MQKVSFQTKDGVVIVADFLTSDSSKAVILVHQLGSSKEAFSVLADLFNENGFAVLSLDLRGHGESAGKKSLSSPERLTPADFQDMNWDLSGARNFLTKKGFSEFYIVGASIGANLAIIFPSENEGFKAAVALSPGEDYKSLQPLSFAEKTAVPTLLVASSDDSYSFESCQKLDAVFAAEHEFYRLQNVGHGTYMLNLWPKLSQKIVDWCKGH
ncbi:MAG: alpha/beta fold hydrolase [Candidatus Micrarchaeota archaeon]